MRLHADWIDPHHAPIECHAPDPTGARQVTRAAEAYDAPVDAGVEKTTGDPEPPVVPENTGVPETTGAPETTGGELPTEAPETTGAPGESPTGGTLPTEAPSQRPGGAQVTPPSTSTEGGVDGSSTGNTLPFILVLLAGISALLVTKSPLPETLRRMR